MPPRRVNLNLTWDSGFFFPRVFSYIEGSRDGATACYVGSGEVRQELLSGSLGLGGVETLKNICSDQRATGCFWVRLGLL